MPELPSIALERIQEAYPAFSAWMQTPRAKAVEDDRDEKLRLHQQLLSYRSIDQLGEVELMELFKSLWANAMWTNKNYVAQQTIQENGLDNLRYAIKSLLYGREPVSKRYHEFRKRVKGLGPASITELLAFTNPSSYCLWNGRTKQGLTWIGLKQEVPKRYQITGEDYERLTAVLQAIAKELQRLGAARSDLLGVDFFLYFLSQEVTSEALAPDAIVSDEGYDFDHDDIVGRLQALGDGLGFTAEKGKAVAKGAVLDVIWRARVGNLGTIAYAFEVHRKGSMDSAILNLQKARRDPSIQKLVIVSNAKLIKKFQEEIQALGSDDHFRKLVTYLEVREIEKAAEHLAGVKALLERLELR